MFLYLQVPLQLFIIYDVVVPGLAKRILIDQYNDRLRSSEKFAGLHFKYPQSPRCRANP